MSAAGEAKARRTRRRAIEVGRWSGYRMRTLVEEAEEVNADRIETAVAALGPGPLNEEGLRAHVAPLFSQVLSAQGGRIYLANHSLGRPLDVTQDDVREGLALWTSKLGDAWDAWGDEMS